METTIFEKIIAGEVPAEIVYEDDRILAFLDITPVNVGHTLIVPKKKFVNIFDADPEVIAHMARTAHHIACALKEVTSCDGVNILMNNGAAAGQEVLHAHMHVIPRLIDDHAYQPVHNIPYDAHEGKEVAEKLKSKLA